VNPEQSEVVPVVYSDKTVYRIKPFKDNIGFLQEHKKKRLDDLCNNSPEHDIRDTIPLSNYL
jgi:hypothetical protein